MKITNDFNFKLNVVLLAINIMFVMLGTANSLTYVCIGLHSALAFYFGKRDDDGHQE